MIQDQEEITSKPCSTVDDYTPWIESMLMVAAHYRLEYSEENVRLATAWSQDKPVNDVLRNMARQLGLVFKTAKLEAKHLTPWRLPVVVQFQDGQVAMVKTVTDSGEVGIFYGDEKGLESVLPIEELIRNVTFMVILRPAQSVPDARVDDYIKPYEGNWFRQAILRDLKPYAHIMLASLTANILALAGILFSRQVYDRVIPAESFPTLYVLFSGVVIAIVFDFIMRSTRVRIADLLGKRADIRLSDRVFGHALRIRNSARPKSTGTFISQIRELEQVRELMTSTTVSAFADMPFFILFCVLMWYIAGPIVLVPIGALIFLIIPGVLVQRKLRELASEAMRESSLRNAMLVEAIQGGEDIKSLQAEQRFQQQWNHYNAVTADVNLKLRFITNTLGIWAYTIQAGVFATVVLFGAPIVMDGDLTVGSLVAASILASRMMAPMSQITQLMSKWQQGKVALESLNQIMKLPVDNPEVAKQVHRPSLLGKYHLNNTSFFYGGAAAPALNLKSLKIEPGERIAILGKNGAGKTTLLQALSGMMEPSSGELILDGVSLSHIDPADVRRDIGLLTQSSRLFHGSIRENLRLGSPNATNDELLEALNITGISEFVQTLPDGLDHLIMEGGIGLSGGQLQSLLLARLLIKQPNVLLLDEPTASLDEMTEKSIIQKLNPWIEGKTLVVATHRMNMLALVNRIIVVENGQIILDGEKDKVLEILAKAASKSAQTTST